MGRRSAFLLAGLAAMCGIGPAGAAAVPGRSPGAGFVYGGTANGEPFGLWLSADRTQVTGMLFYAESVRCTGGYKEVDFREIAWVLPPIARLTSSDHYFNTDADQLPADGRFRAEASSNDVSYGDAGVWGLPDETLTGRVEGDQARGTFRVSMVLKDKAGHEFARCATPTVHWRAHSAPGGGDTSDVNTDLPIRAGRFSLAQRWNDPVSGHRRDLGRSTGSGTVRGTRATGTYAETDRYVDGHGRTVDVCHFRRFHWSAVSTPADFNG